MKKTVLLVFLSVLLSTAVVVGFIGPVVSYPAETELLMEVDLRVHNTDSGKNFSTIQEAINDNETLDGHTIFVETGTYYERIRLNKSLSINGENRENTIIDGNDGDILLITSENARISEFTLRNGNYGIQAWHASNINISKVRVKECDKGLYVTYSASMTLREVILENNYINFGIGGTELSHYLHDIDETNSINGKTIHYLTNQHDKSVSFASVGYIALINSSKILVSDIVLDQPNYESLLFAYSKDSTIRNVTASSEHKFAAIEIVNSENITFIHNSLKGPMYAIGQTGLLVTGLNNSRIANNKFKHYAIAMWFSNDNIIEHNAILNTSDPDPTYLYSEVGFALLNSNGNTISNNTISNGLLWGNRGMMIYDSDRNIIQGNHIENYTHGIEMSYSRDNVVVGNTLETKVDSISVYGSAGNLFYHNNGKEAYADHDSKNFWDNGVEGNYWASYSAVDANKDGIGNAPYEIAANNTDYYPLMGMFHSFNTSLGCSVNVISNSTIENFRYFESNSAIRMYVSNSSVTPSFGFCRVCIPHALMDVSNISVIIDNGETPVLYHNYTLCDNGTHIWIYFAYEHSTHKVEIVPEFPTCAPILLILIVLTVAIAIYKRRLLKTPTH